MSSSVCLFGPAFSIVGKKINQLVSFRFFLVFEVLSRRRFVFPYEEFIIRFASFGLVKRFDKLTASITQFKDQLKIFEIGSVEL